MQGGGGAAVGLGGGLYANARIRIGEGYQATSIPSLRKRAASKSGASLSPAVGTQVWIPSKASSRAGVEKYLKDVESMQNKLATADCALSQLHVSSYKPSQALKALRDETRFKQIAEQQLLALAVMTEERAEEFGNALSKVGKDFHAIHKLMKQAVSIPTLILYYFLRFKHTEGYTRWKERWSKYNMEYCSVCETTDAGGTLLCCDGCPLAYHLKCCDPVLTEDSLPEGEWFCTDCVRKNTWKDKTGSSRAPRTYKFCPMCAKRQLVSFEVCVTSGCGHVFPQERETAGRKGLKAALPAVMQPVTDWREGSKVEVLRMPSAGEGLLAADKATIDRPLGQVLDKATDKDWYRSTIIMRSKNRVKVQYDGHACEWDEWIWRGSERVARIGAHTKEPPAAAASPMEKDHAMAVAVASSDGRGVTRNGARRASRPLVARGQVYQRVTVKDLRDEAELVRAQQWVAEAKAVLDIPARRIAFLQNASSGSEDGGAGADPESESESESDVTSAEEAGPSAKKARTDDGDSKDTAAADADGGEDKRAARRRRPSARRVRELVRRARSIPAYLPQEGKLVTLLDDADEWQQRVMTRKCTIQAKTTRGRAKPGYDEVLAVLHAAVNLPIQLPGWRNMRRAVWAAQSWSQRAREALQPEVTVEDSQLVLLGGEADELQVEVPNLANLQKELLRKREAQKCVPAPPSAGRLASPRAAPQRARPVGEPLLALASRLSSCFLAALSSVWVRVAGTTPRSRPCWSVCAEGRPRRRRTT